MTKQTITKAAAAAAALPLLALGAQSAFAQTGTTSTGAYASTTTTGSGATTANTGAGAAFPLNVAMIGVGLAAVAAGAFLAKGRRA